MDINIEKFKQTKVEAKSWYKSVQHVYCPYLKKKVHFNARGLDHIKFKEWNKTRLVSDQFLRLKFLRLVPTILEKSGTLQEYSETKNFERKKMNSRWSKRLVSVKYYGFIALLKDTIRVKVIVKEVERGQPIFWSIIPFWKNKKNPITKEIKKVFHEGDLEND